MDYGYEETPQNPVSQWTEGAQDFFSNKDNIPKMLAVLVIIAVLTWYFVIRSAPGTIAVQVNALDDETGLAGVEVDLLDEQENIVATSYTSEDGMAEFKNVASKKQYRVEAIAEDPFVAATEYVELASNEQKSVAIELEKELGVEITPIFEVSVPKNCDKTLEIEAKNKNARAAIVQLVADGELKKIFSSQETTLESGETKLIQAVVSGKTLAKEIKAKIRLKYSKQGIEITVKPGEESKVSINPSTLSLRNAPGEQITQRISLKNEGSTLLSIKPSDLQIQSKDLQGAYSIEFLDDEPIPAGQEKTAILTIDVPYDAAGEIIAQMTTTTECNKIVTPISIKIE